MESNLGEIKILPDNIPNSDLSFKVIIIGNSNVGKSCISIRATKNVFESEHIATVGFELFCYNVSIKEKILKLEIWDTCGSETIEV